MGVFNRLSKQTAPYENWKQRENICSNKSVSAFSWSILHNL